MPGNRAVQLVRAGLELAEVQLRGLPGGDVRRDEVGPADRQVVHHRPVVAHREHAAGVDGRDREVDGELGQVGLDRFAGGAVVVSGAQGEPDADDRGDHGEHREPEDEQGPTVAAQAVALELTLEVVEARWIVDRFRHGVRFSGVVGTVSWAVGSGCAGPKSR